MTTLRDPINIGTISVKNRLVLPPVCIDKAVNGEVNDIIVNHYDMMTRGGNVGLVIMEHCYVTQSGKASDGQISISRDSDIEGLKRVVDVVHRNGSKIFCQINHCGSSGDPKITGGPLMGPSSALNLSPGAKTRLHPEAMSLDDMVDIRAAFTTAAVRVKMAGFDGVEIHCAHGYLLNEFYSPLTNKRNDLYTGKNIMGRLRYPNEVIKSVRMAVGPEFPISLRFGASDYKQGGSMETEALRACEAFIRSGVNLLNISGGMCGFVNPMNRQPGYFSDLTETIKANVAVPVVLTGGIRTPEFANQMLAEYKADLIGVARAMIQNPRWADIAMAQ